MLCQAFLHFLQQINEFDNTERQILDSIYPMKLKLLLNSIFGMKTQRFCHYKHDVVMEVIIA